MIDKEQVEHIVNLARLGLDETEKEAFQQELSAILDFVKKLRAADVSDAKAMAGGTELANIMREDKVKPKQAEERKLILANAPKRKRDYIEVKAIL